MDTESHGIPSNPYNSHAWITGTPQIGDGTWIGAFTLIDGQGGLVIGKGCNISSGAQILTHSTVFRCISEGQIPIQLRPTVLEDYVFVGSNAVILMGSRIGHHSIIGAGAVILEGTTVEPYSLMVGVPAKFVRNIANEICPQTGK